MTSCRKFTFCFFLGFAATAALTASNVAASDPPVLRFESGNVVAANKTVFCELTTKGKLVRKITMPKDLTDHALLDFQVSSSGKLYALFSRPELQVSIAVYAPEKKAWDVPDSLQIPFRGKPKPTSSSSNDNRSGKLMLFDGKLLAVMVFGNSWLFDLDSDQARAFPSSQLARIEGEDSITFWELEPPNYADRQIYRRVVSLKDGSLREKSFASFLPSGFPNQNGSLTRLYIEPLPDGMSFSKLALGWVSSDGKVAKSLPLDDLVKIPEDPEAPNERRRKPSPIYEDLDLSADDESVICCSNGKSLLFVGPDLSKSSVRVVEVEQEFKFVRWIPEVTNE